MLGNFGKIAGMMKNAKKIEEMMGQAQDELSKIIVTAEAGAGAVKIEMTAKYEAIRIQLDDEVLKEPKEILEDLLTAAVNDATRKVSEETKSRMMGLSSLLGGGDLGDLLGGK